MIRITWKDVFVLLAVLFAGCGAGGKYGIPDDGSQLPRQNPVPVLLTISPSTITAGSADFTLRATGTDFVTMGTGFIDESVLYWNGLPISTSGFSDTLLEARIPASLVAKSGTAIVTVLNPAPGGGFSNPMSFSITPAEGN